eukprot:TRINITY_DN70431_c0_g1_i1.p1 TRINITY_DN70431_c0_g1~~TRINITY_DN70431_c0_g1_i1.p1  ORF type:complete len:538 (+),score=238.93 TRINITY_DN70431_c0_g1_i1:90-1616(+)
MSTVQEVVDMCASLRAVADSGVCQDKKWRRRQLQQVIKMLEENTDEIATAVHSDLRCSKFSVIINEINQVIPEAKDALEHLDEWAAPQPKEIPLMMQPGDAWVHSEPHGLVLVMAPWNVPFYLVMNPVVGALAAGNAMLLKPSSRSAHTSAIIAKLVPRYLDPNAVRVMEGPGGGPLVDALLKQKFDFIMYTGSPNIGKVIMHAAAEHLTPLCLELGGKNPVVVDKSANLLSAAKRVLYGKFNINCGQVCVGPDYALVHRDVLYPFVKTMKQVLHGFYNGDAQRSGDYARMIMPRYAERLRVCIEECRGKSREIVGGKVDVADCYVEPTIIIDPPDDCELMREEVFGPVLPVKTVDDIGEAIAWITKRDKPLALYCFAEDAKVQDRVMRETSSGGYVINDVMKHLACPELPFGGVGNSGFGAYHGRHSFRLFSHEKAVLKRPTTMYGSNEAVDPAMMYPPYKEWEKKVLIACTKYIPPRMPWYVTLITNLLKFYVVLLIAKRFMRVKA